MRAHIRSGTEVLDGLRGLAILLVLGYHSWLFSWFTPQVSLAGRAIPLDVVARTGYLGVDLFFLISGFVLFFPYAVAGPHDAPPHGIREYARRRAVKILPSYGLALAASLAVAWPLAGGPEAVARTLAQHVFFVHSFTSDALGQVNSVFWSLAIEVQFYLFFPALARAFRRRPALVCGAMLAVALAYRLIAARCCLLDERITRELPAFLDVFACGMLAAYLVARLRASGAALARYRAACTVAAMALAVFTFAILASANAVQYDPGGRERWDIWHRTALALTAAAFVVTSCFAQPSWRAIMTNAPFRFFSLISYNLYLWHTLVMLWLLRHHVPRAATSNPYDDDRWKFAYLALGWSASILVSTVVTYFVERPLLATIAPQRFAFDWRFRRLPSGARSKTRT